MENLTAAQWHDFVVVALAVFACIVLLGNVAKTFREWRKPREDLETWRRDVNVKLNDNDDRLKKMEEGNRVISRGILALLSHEINGNSIDKLQASQTEIQNYLIDR